MMMQTAGVSEIEIRRNGVVVCVCADESCLYPDEIMKDMKANGYKFYQGGKIYKFEKKQKE
jgi:hypothetical protein